MTTKAIVLLAHGSSDPLWRRSIEAVRDQVIASDPKVHCVCAYLAHCAPDIHAAVDELLDHLSTAAPPSRLRVVPLLLGVGRHVQEDLPRLAAELKRRHPRLQIDFLAPVADDPRLLQTLAAIALDLDNEPVPGSATRDG